MRPEDGEAQRHQAVLAGKARLQQAFDFTPRMRHFPEGLLPRLGIGFGRAVEKRRPYARLGDAVYAPIGVRRGRVVVAPVGERGGTAIDLVERADEVGDVDVLGREQCREAGVHVLEIFEHRPVAGHTAQAGLPGVHVRVDEARYRDHAGGVDDDRSGRLELRTDGGDAIILDEDVTEEVTNLGVHRNNARTADYFACHGRLRFRTRVRRSS